MGKDALPACTVQSAADRAKGFRGHWPEVSYGVGTGSDVLATTLADMMEGTGLLPTPTQLQAVLLAKGVDAGDVTCQLERCIKAKKRELAQHWDFGPTEETALLAILKALQAADKHARQADGEAMDTLTVGGAWSVSCLCVILLL